MMSRFILKFSLLITLLLGATNFAVGVLGENQLPSLTLRGFTQDCDGQPRPCWYGIVPGLTPIGEVKEDLLKNGYAINSKSNATLYATKSIDGDCQNISILFDSRVKQINIDLCEPVLLGDFIKQFNQPEFIIMDPSSVWYQGEIQMVFGKYGLSSHKVTYHTPVQELILFPNNSTIPQLRQPWLDLLVQRKYCDFKGLRDRCST